MKKLMLLTFYLSFFCIAFASDSVSVLSPDRKIRVEIATGTTISYKIFLDDQLIVVPSFIGLSLKNGLQLNGPSSKKSFSFKAVHETIIHPLPDNRRIIPDHYNELTIKCNPPFEILFRVYDDGVAYRIRTNSRDSMIVAYEVASVNFPGGAKIIAPIMQEREGQDKYHSGFEELYQQRPIDSIGSNALMFSPLLVETGNTKIALTESDISNYPGMFLKRNEHFGLTGDFAPYPLEETIAEGDYPERIVKKRADYIARIPGIQNLPWRVLIIARGDKDIPANDLVYRLGAPSKIEDPSWIHPAKCTDEWIIDINLFNVPFKTGINTASYKYYIDFAKRFGFERIMMDAGWSDTKDLFRINPNIDMDTILAYAKEKGIKVSMWTLSMTLDKQLESALNRFNKWGVDFIMTDFIDRDDEKANQFFQRIAEACAKHHIMIMFHGCPPPKGFNRTFPNNITREAVLGSEYNAWSDKPTPPHDLTLPFTRMLAGPFDYEPGLLDNATRAQFKPIWGKVMSQGTRSHQLAMFIVYNNPMQIFSGNPSQGMMEPAFMQLLASFPTTWDTTLIIDAKIGNYIYTARKKNNDWFVGGMTDWNARDFVFSPDFLPPGKYEAVLCEDGINADRYPSDYAIKEFEINSQQREKINIHLAPGGGFALRIRKQ